MNWSSFFKNAFANFWPSIVVTRTDLSALNKISLLQMQAGDSRSQQKVFLKTAKFFLRKLLQFCSARCLAIDREKGEERGWVRERETEWVWEREKESTTEREGERGEEIEWEREKPFKQKILCLAFWWKGAGVSKRHLQKMFCFFFSAKFRECESAGFSFDAAMLGCR